VKALFAVISLLLTANLGAADALPSWNEGPAKASIVAFVKTVTDKKSKEYVAPAQRIATFDNDGTLWA
jgi:hypothetical protein